MGIDFSETYRLPGMRCNSYKLHQRNLMRKQGKKKTFLTMKLDKLGQTPKDAVECQLLEILKTLLDKALSCLI